MKNISIQTRKKQPFNLKKMSKVKGKKDTNQKIYEYIYTHTTTKKTHKNKIKI